MKTWTTLAIENGGALTLGRYFKPNRAERYRAAMAWIDLTDPDIEGYGNTPELALDALEDALMQDAADEMVKNGAA